MGGRILSGGHSSTPSSSSRTRKGHGVFAQWASGKCLHNLFRLHWKNTTSIKMDFRNHLWYRIVLRANNKSKRSCYNLAEMSDPRVRDSANLIIKGKRNILIFFSKKSLLERRSFSRLAQLMRLCFKRWADSDDIRKKYSNIQCPLTQWAN